LGGAGKLARINKELGDLKASRDRPRPLEAKPFAPATKMAIIGFGGGKDFNLRITFRVLVFSVISTRDELARRKFGGIDSIFARTSWSKSTFTSIQMGQGSCRHPAQMGFHGRIGDDLRETAAKSSSRGS